MGEPLNLPRGSVRSIIALVVIIGLVPVAIWAPSDGQTFYAALAGVVLRDYFHTRAAQNAQDGPAVGKASFGGDPD